MKKLKTDFFQKLLFSASPKKLKIDFFKIRLIFKKLSKYMKINFFIKKVIIYQNNPRQTHPKSSQNAQCCRLQLSKAVNFHLMSWASRAAYVPEIASNSFHERVMGTTTYTIDPTVIGPRPPIKVINAFILVSLAYNIKIDHKNQKLHTIISKG